jgi:hypothetical protein
VGEKAMTSHMTFDKTTGVAFIDVKEASLNARIRVISVSELLNLRSQVRARYDEESGALLGLIIEDYRAFRREIMLKYVAFRVERIVELFVCSVKGALSHDHSDRPRLAAV